MNNQIDEFELEEQEECRNKKNLKEIKVKSYVPIWFVVVFLVWIGLSFLESNEEMFDFTPEPVLKSRNVETSDLEIRNAGGITNYYFYVTPYTDVEEFSLELYFYGSSYELIHRETVGYDYIYTNEEYEFKYTTGLVNNLKISSLKYIVRGKVYYYE